MALATPRIHHDALDWVRRVVAQGGSCSQSTLRAVSAFCDAIDRAGIRDRFYRLNLFAGNSDASLAAVRTPLFRGPSLTGTQYGGTTDTNVNFVAGDYAETGGGAGLTGNGSTKYLNTGYPANTLAASNTHLGVGVLATTTQSGIRTAIGAYNNGANTLEIMLRSSDATARPGIFTRFTTATDRMGENIGTTGAALAAGNNVAAWPTFYRNGVAVGTDATTSQDYPSAHAIWVFANNVAGTTPAINITACRLGWYSIGATMTSTQALAFHNAIAAFSTALSRT